MGFVVVGLPSFPLRRVPPTLVPHDVLRGRERHRDVHRGRVQQRVQVPPEPLLHHVLQGVKKKNPNPLSIFANPLRDDHKKTQNPPGKRIFEGDNVGAGREGLPPGQAEPQAHANPIFCVGRYFMKHLLH